MDLTAELVDIVEHEHSLGRILDSATQLIATRLGLGLCQVFLLDAHGIPVRYRSGDAALGSEDSCAVAYAAPIATRAVRERRVTRLRTPESSLIAVPLLIRASPVGVVVLRRVVDREFTDEEETELETIASELGGIIENARVIEALDLGDPAWLSAEPDAGDEPRSDERLGVDEVGLRGVGASPGVAIGSAVFRGTHRVNLESQEFSAKDPVQERARVRTAIAKTRNDLLRIQEAAAREIDEDHAFIFAHHLLMLTDPTLLERIDRQVAQGLDAAWAINAVLQEFERRLRLVPDPYIRERVDDIDDLRCRLLDHALGSGDRELFRARVVVTQRIPPSLVVDLKTEGARALITEAGGETSHGVLLARALGIPTVTGLADQLASVGPGDPLIVDGRTGVVIVRPSAETLSSYEEVHRQAEQARTEHAKFRDVLAQTADGVRVKLQANVGVASDIAAALENGAEGIGLYRTELPFMLRDAFPTLRQQVRIYRKAYDAFPQGPIHFRILDLGGDKFAIGGPIAAARSAFHGYRSIRVLFDHPEVLRDQIQAFALAAGDRPLSILVPMVSSLEELRRVRAQIDQALQALAPSLIAQRSPKIGAMIEVPAAVELAGDIAREVDYLSIGTNDLMQYALVVDREDSRMAPMNDPYHPALLRMVGRVAEAALKAEKPVGVCGAIAARPEMALALIALGVDSLSVVPSVVPELKQALASACLEPMRSALPELLALSDARSLAAALRSAFGRLLGPDGPVAQCGSP